ncbi:MAG: hypothetical protein NTU95_08435 [Methanothrix sp.]|nr:hypothetical protein [Methanothrix sp.]
MHTYIPQKRANYLQKWGSPTEIAAILIIIFLIAVPSGECKQYEAGRSYTFIGPAPPQGQSYSYLWTATDGVPKISHDASFQWTAPLVTEPTKVVISLLISSGAVGCTSRNETELLVLPSQITPELECVRSNSDGSYTAKFAYDNPNNEITIPKGDNNQIDPVPLSGSQPETFSSGHHSFTVIFDPQIPIVWSLDGRQANASIDSPRCNIGQSPLVVTKAANTTIVSAGSAVAFTITVKNVGEAEIGEVELVDTLSPGLIYKDASPKPDSINGNMLVWNLGTLGPQGSPTDSRVIILQAADADLCPNPAIIISPPRASNEEERLSVLAAASGSDNLLQIIDALTRNKTLLEVKLDGIRKHRDAFSENRANLTSTARTIAGTNLTLNNYTNVSTGETLNEQLNATGFLIASEYRRPAKGDLMRTVYGAGGGVLSDFYDFLLTRESLLIEYDRPSRGYRIYTVRYYATGDTLIITVGPYGNTISRMYEKTPGQPEISGSLKNCAKAYGSLGGTPIESNEACVAVIWSCQPPSPTASLQALKEADRKSITVADVGLTIKYKYTVRNTGGIKIVSLTLSDDKLGPVILNEPVDLNPGDEIIRYGDYTVKPEDVTRESLINIVVAKGSDPNGVEVVSDPANAEVKIENRQKITPGLECIRPNPDGSYAAKFVYDNPNNEITIPRGDNNRIEPEPLSGSQPEIFLSGHHPFTVNFDIQTPITWALDGRQATASNESQICTTGPPSLVVTKEANSTSAFAGSTVIFTINVKNEGYLEVNDVELVDILSPGLIYQDATPVPDSISGNMLTWNLGTLVAGASMQIHLSAIVDPEVCAAESSISPSTGSNTENGQLSIMAVTSDSAELQQIMDSLSRNKTKLEAKQNSVRKQRDAFERAGAILSSGNKTMEGANYAFNNYTNKTTGETLVEMVNARGLLVSSEYERPSKGDLMITEYGADGIALSDAYTFRPTRESLKIEYNKPKNGYKTYTVRCYATGDTLIIIVDALGNVVSREYKKTPGLPQATNPLKNCAHAIGNAAGIQIESNEACDTVAWTCKQPEPTRELKIIKAADPKIVSAAGQTIKYTYTVENAGRVKIVSLTINDNKLGPIVLNQPVDLDPGETFTFSTNYTVKAEDLAKPSLINIAVAEGTDPDGMVVISNQATEEVKVIVIATTLTKTASPKVVKAGDRITYTITYDSGLAEGETKIVDTYPKDVIFIAATPPPSIGDNIWIGPSKGTITILVEVAQNVGNFTFNLGQGVTGTGFVNVHSNICTEPLILTNRADMYNYTTGAPLNTTSADVSVGPPKTCTSVREHGSGKYASEDVLTLRNSNRSIDWNKSVKASYRPTSFSLPKGRSIDYTSKWTELAKAKNYATGATINEEYTHADRIERESRLKLDENGSILLVNSDFEGVGHIGLLKKAKPIASTNVSSIFQAQEDYVGVFNISRKFDEYGQNVEYEKSATGQGYVVAEKKIRDAQTSYEFGSGSYQSEERISTAVNYIAKDINLTHALTNFTYTPSFSTGSDLLWREGMWSKTDNSLIREEFSSIKSLEKESTARGLSEMETKAKLAGKADFRTIYSDTTSNRTNEVDMDEQYVGEYDLNRKTLLTGVSKYDRPHISLTKEARVDLHNNTFADYRITVENNGNRALEPVYVVDVFPTGTEYITSSLRPSELTANQANWTLLSLGIGSKAIIDLRLNITTQPNNLINRVVAAGRYADGWTTAMNFSAVQLSWLDCCPPQIWATKTARVDTEDTNVVWYSLSLLNREKYVMVAFMMDQLPEGMELLNSSQEPSENRSNLMTWTILDLNPGESRSIVYRARARDKGIYVNRAHIEAFSVDGPDAAVAEVSARVNIGVTGAASRGKSSDWQPPACFGLNCSDQIISTDWVPCFTCAEDVPEAAANETACSSCMYQE